MDFLQQEFDVVEVDCSMGAIKRKWGLIMSCRATYSHFKAPGLLWSDSHGPMGSLDKVQELLKVLSTGPRRAIAAHICTR
jgi:hypothetical protein